MIEVLQTLPANVVGFKAKGTVTKVDYDTVVFPKVEAQVRKDVPLNYLFWVDTPIKEFSVGAWVQDAWLGIKNIAKWNRVAIVSDEKSVRDFTDVIGHTVPGEYKGFSTAEIDSAIQWASNKE
jgi:hypothetical protein